MIPAWSAAPLRSPLIAAPLPAREEFTYISVAGAVAVDQWNNPVDKAVAGDADVTALELYTENVFALIKSVTMWVDEVYGVTLLNGYLPVSPRESGWIFTVDGHTFYLLNFVLGRTLVYDFTAQQWYVWYTEGRPYWNMFRGINWRGRVIGADAEEPKVWEIDMFSSQDEGLYDIPRAVSGFQTLRGRDSVRQGSLRISGQRRAGEDATVQMRFSDDGGTTWSDFYTVELTGEDQEIEFRSLGRISAPGRIWEIYDTGGLVRIDAADADIEALT